MEIDLLPEYLIEAREHLDAVVSGLLRLDELPNGDAAQSEILQSLFRSFHTMKGLSAMAEQPMLENIAHRCESLLRPHNANLPVLDDTVVDTLLAATKAMTERLQLLENHGRTATQDMLAIPAELIDRIDRLSARILETAAPDDNRVPIGAEAFPGLPAHILQKLTQKDAALLKQGLEQGARIYIGQFSPTRETLNKGTSIATVLQRIGEAGKLIKNIPLTSTQPDAQSGVQVTFFVVFLSESPLVDLIEKIGIPSLQISKADVGKDDASQEAEKPRSDITLTDISSISIANAEGESEAEESVSTVMIRIGLRKMDEIMRLTGELMITKSRLLSGLQQLDASGSERELAYTLSEEGHRLERGLRTLREAILEIHLVPIREAFHRLPLVLRDVMRGSEKKVRMTFSGEDIELDRIIVERLVDPLIHIVRNAFDHGIELPEQRRLAGKPEIATIHVSANRDGSQVLLRVRDDGAGVDVAKVLARARTLGFKVPDISVASMTDVLQCLCQPGFSTQTQASRISGRGVGMDVVAYNVSSLNGILSLESMPGEGSCFGMQIPITLSVTDALLVRAAGQLFAIPIGMITETITISPSEISRIERNRVVRFRDAAVPTIALQELYDLPGEFDWENERPALLSTLGDERFLVPVDALVGKQEIVIKSLEDPLVRVTGVIGAAELGDGQVVLVLDLPGMLANKWRARNVL
ncbi:MAG: chemotaxis protein CheA [Bacteroidota bacterium]